MEFVWLRKIDFFPRRPDLSTLKKICIATKSRNLGDALALTTLPRKLKEKFPGLKVTTYPRAFNPIVFEGNSFVDRISHLPANVYGDDANWGEGQLINLKEAFFDLPLSSPPRPELHLLPREKEWAETLCRRACLHGNDGKPICAIHPWGTTRKSVAELQFWDKLVSRWEHKFRFWQVGLEGHPIIKGCEYYLLTERAFKEARKLFAFMSRVQLFIGVDSGPMHVARAFDVPSMIVLNHVEPHAVLARRQHEPHFVNQNWICAPLYSENKHVSTIGGLDRAIKETESFLDHYSVEVL